MFKLINHCTPTRIPKYVRRLTGGIMSDPIFKKRHRKILAIYLQMIEAVSASTDDYLYLNRVRYRADPLYKSDPFKISAAGRRRKKDSRSRTGSKQSIRATRLLSMEKIFSVSLTAHRKSTTWNTACLTAKATAAGSAAAARFRMTRTDSL